MASLIKYKSGTLVTQFQKSCDNVSISVGWTRLVSTEDVDWSLREASSSSSGTNFIQTQVSASAAAQNMVSAEILRCT